MSQGWKKYISFGQAKQSAGIVHLCVGCEAADYPHKAQNFDEVHSVKSMPLQGGLWYIPPTI